MRGGGGGGRRGGTEIYRNLGFAWLNAFQLLLVYKREVDFEAVIHQRI